MRRVAERRCGVGLREGGGGSLIATGKWGVVMREQGGRQGTQLEMLGA